MCVYMHLYTHYHGQVVESAKTIFPMLLEIAKRDGRLTSDDFVGLGDIDHRKEDKNEGSRATKKKPRHERALIQQGTVWINLDGYLAVTVAEQRKKEEKKAKEDKKRAAQVAKKKDLADADRRKKKAIQQRSEARKVMKNLDSVNRDEWYVEGPNTINDPWAMCKLCYMVYGAVAKVVGKKEVAEKWNKADTNLGVCPLCFITCDPRTFTTMRTGMKALQQTERTRARRKKQTLKEMREKKQLEEKEEKKHEEENKKREIERRAEEKKQKQAAEKRHKAEEKKKKAEEKKRQKAEEKKKKAEEKQRQKAEEEKKKSEEKQRQKAEEEKKKAEKKQKANERKRRRSEDVRHHAVQQQTSRKGRKINPPKETNFMY